MFRLNVLRLGRAVVQSVKSRSANDSLLYKKCGCRFLTADSFSKEVDSSRLNGVKQTEETDSNLEYAFKLGLDPNLISEVKKCVGSFNIYSDQFAYNCKVLIDFGFTSEEVVKFMKDCPKLFLAKGETLENSLYLWTKFPIGDDMHFKLLVKHPELIDLMGQDVMMRINELLPYFKKDRDIGFLFINCPATVYENWETLKAKLDFLHSHNIPMKFVANCNALDFSLREMKTRFMFLERAGLYKQRIDLFKKDAKVKNPHLSEIMCADDERFAERVAQLTLIEYEAFVEVYNAELDNIENSE